MVKEIIVEVSTFHVAGNPTKLICLGLGSCLGIAMYEPQAKIGGLGHAMLPWFEEGRNKSNLAKYVDTSIYLMVDAIIDNGGKKHNIYSKIVGGARMFQTNNGNLLDIGKKNIIAARETLKNERIRIKAEEVGGTCGRTIIFNLKTGKIQIRIARKRIQEI